MIRMMYCIDDKEICHYKKNCSIVLKSSKKFVEREHHSINDK